MSATYIWVSVMKVWVMSSVPPKRLPSRTKAFSMFLSAWKLLRARPTAARMSEALSAQTAPPPPTAPLAWRTRS